VTKYISKSLIYRAFNGLEHPFFEINEYNIRTNTAKIEGVVDMLETKYSENEKIHIINKAIFFLKEMACFHIDATSRSRYARATYYLGIAMDLYYCLGKENEWEEYKAMLIKQNSRKPAFKDEMRMKFGENYGNIYAKG
jgi:hypothetical protein